MGKSTDDLVTAEFAQNYEMMRHYLETQNSILKTFLTVYFAVVYGFILLNDKKLETASDTILIIGLISSLVVIAMMIKNRFYFVMILRRLDFLRTHFLFGESSVWGTYPVFYRKNLGDTEIPVEESRVARPISTFGLTVIMMCVGCAFLIYLVDFGLPMPLFCRIVMAVLALMALLFIFYCFANAQDNEIKKHA
ncbi:MAG: hypothetical protein AB1690_13705 [Candidatus Zixiibacteriota bacterium]